MEISCPLTCGYCIETKNSGSVTTSTVPNEKVIIPSKCIDEADDCADRINFCNRKFYKRMMSLQCAKTCKFCDPDEEYEEEEVEENSREIHLSTLRSRTGEETVQKLEELKIVDNVIELLKNATSPSVEKKTRRFSKKPGNFSSEVVDQEECVDKASDCERNQKLCTHKAYSSLFRKICAKTCEYCGLADSTIDLESSGEFL
uniref:ShKT domain-containing protein n=1 Tax=Caenorhabditis tropicalis TaxID=1561998 RepID=A0A1I7UW06_9PELO